MVVDVDASQRVIKQYKWHMLLNPTFGAFSSNIKIPAALKSQTLSSK
jgi:hypothetical protein